jgi:DeoR/GlpR family transcriptional regulator of sugar metabolism
LKLSFGSAEQLVARDSNLRVKYFKTLGISQITIRKNLDHLHSRRLLQRSHAGARRLGYIY